MASDVKKVDVDEQIRVRDALVAALRADLVGPMARDEVLESRPSRWYVAGFLVPSSTPMEDRQDEDIAEELSIDADRGDEPDDDVKAHSAFLPSSMGLSFLVGPGVEKVDVTARWADYQQLTDQETNTYQQRERERRRTRAVARAQAEGKPPPAWTRPDKETSATEEDEETLADGRPRYRYWRRVTEQSPTVTVRLDRGNSQAALTKTRDVYLQAVVRPAPERDGPPGARVVSLFLVNGRDPQRNAADERYLFQTVLEVDCRKGFQPRRNNDPSQHPDDRRNDLQFRDRPEWAVGHGVSTEVLESHGVGPAATCTRVATTWLPVARVYRMKARDLDGVETHMERLAELSDPSALHGGMAALMDAYTTWIAQQEANASGIAGERRQRTAAELVSEARLALARIQAGIQRLVDDPVAFRAFQLTNKVMGATARKQRPDIEPHWRLFQLAFLLLNIQGTADAEHEDREHVELLFFPTGGGKTEAYLGVAAFTLFMRRLRHQSTPHKGAGVGVLLRYTLRLLTLDQLKRAAQLTCAMELERRDDPGALGPHRFTVGVWVGRKATANRLSDVRPTINKIKEGKPLFNEPAPLPLEGCPWCDTPFDEHAYTLLPERVKEPDALVVSCANEECAFNTEYDEEQPEMRAGLPIVTVDEHVYRELPSILIGTVDKFASLPWRGASGNLFGRVKAEDEKGFYGNNENPPPTATPLPDGLLPPDLIIQDELHLITGPLGTMVGLYETAIDALCRDKVPRGPKILASTATARRATEQIQAIFARQDVHLFPPQGLEEGDTFFAQQDRTQAKSRVYVGVAAPGRALKLLASRTYACLLGAAQKQWQEAGPPGKLNPADTYMSLVAYFNALRDLGGAQRVLQEEVNGRTRKLSERRPLDEDASEHFADRLVSYDILELTSRQSTDDITKATERLRKPYTDKNRKQKTDVLLASSMISVGVDISRLGLMVVNGQPRTVAEYIQASSRVGRDSPGLVVTTFSLYKPRDRSHYERFESFHESFYRFVEAASVTPFSTRAIDRGLAGVVVSLARHLPPRMARPEQVERVGDVTDLEERLAGLLVSRAIAHITNAPPQMAPHLRARVREVLYHWTELVKAVKDAGDTLRYSPWESRKHTALLHTAVDDLAGETYVEHLECFRVPTSMRDVEPSVHIWVDRPQSKGI